MSEASQLKINVAAEMKNNRSFSCPITLNKVIDWIKRQDLDDYTTRGLIELASKYPNQALPSFKKNFNLMLQRVRAKRKKDQGEIIDEQPKKEIGQAVESESLTFEEAFQQGFQQEADEGEV